MTSLQQMPDDSKPLVFGPAEKRPYFTIAALDSLIANNLAEEMAGNDIAIYRDERFEDLSELPERARAWYRGLAIYAMRMCRSAWTAYAYQVAVERAILTVEHSMQNCFLRPSPVDTSILIRMPPAEIRARMSILVTEIILAHRSALDGTVEPPPGVLEMLDAESRTKK